MNKLCNNCGKIKNQSQFRKQKSAKDGLQTQCKQCAAQKWKNYYNKNSDKVKLKVQNWRNQLKSP